jgi:hypothetical protein
VQHMSGQREGRREERLADMWMHVGGGARADRQGMQLVEGDTMGGSMDGVSSLLGTTSDMPFVGTRTRAWADRIQEERAAKVSVQGLFDGGGGDHHVPRLRKLNSGNAAHSRIPPPNPD